MADVMRNYERAYYLHGNGKTFCKHCYKNFPPVKKNLLSFVCLRTIKNLFRNYQKFDCKKCYKDILFEPCDIIQLQIASDAPKVLIRGMVEAAYEGDVPSFTRKGGKFLKLDFIERRNRILCQEAEKAEKGGRLKQAKGKKKSSAGNLRKRREVLAKEQGIALQEEVPIAQDQEKLVGIVEPNNGESEQVEGEFSHLWKDLEGPSAEQLLGEFNEEDARFFADIIEYPLDTQMAGGDLHVPENPLC